MKVDLYAGTVGMSVWFSKDLGETWARKSSALGLNAECRVWTLASHRAIPGRLYAGGIDLFLPRKLDNHQPSAGALAQ